MHALQGATLDTLGSLNKQLLPKSFIIIVSWAFWQRCLAGPSAITNRLQLTALEKHDDTIFSQQLQIST